jgi:hypothetical protein
MHEENCLSWLLSVKRITISHAECYVSLKIVLATDILENVVMTL